MHNHNGDPGDDSEVEISDLPPDETRSIVGALVDLWERLLDRARDVHITMQPPEDEDDEDDQCDFDVRVMDLPIDLDKDSNTYRSSLYLL